jgi:hypothetical protein
LVNTYGAVGEFIEIAEHLGASRYGTIDLSRLWRGRVRRLEMGEDMVAAPVEAHLHPDGSPAQRAKHLALQQLPPLIAMFGVMLIEILRRH